MNATLENMKQYYEYFNGRIDEMPISIALENHFKYYKKIYTYKGGFLIGLEYDYMSGNNLKIIAIPINYTYSKEVFEIIEIRKKKEKI